MKACNPPFSLKPPQGKNGRDNTNKRIFRGTKMSHIESSTGTQNKTRGRPFVKGHKRGKSDCKILDNSGHALRDRRETVEPNRVKFNKNLPEQEDSGNIDIPDIVMKKLCNQFEEATSIPQNAEKEENIGVLEKIEFTNGENKLSIVFSAINHRKFKIQVFLNEDTELRPVTYQGSRSATSYWNLLKGVLKNDR